ncbi:hypothetical protein FACS1894166_04850 [Bacilli bacterium]|nr:hypothetical protein FACS1894166_04850 [Bacilli bacterium]
MVFSGYDGIDLLASDFTFTDNDDSSKNISADSVISAAAGHYRIAISGDWADEDTVEIIINKVGFVCSDPGTVTLNNV